MIPTLHSTHAAAASCSGRSGVSPVLGARRSPLRCLATSASSPRDEANTTVTSRRGALIVAIAAASVVPTGAALALRDGAPLEIEPIEPFSLEDFTSEAGWTETGSGLLWKVEREGTGDTKKGIFEAVDHFQPFPFVTVNYTAYTPDGKGFASTFASRRTWSYQAGVRQEIQDEDGAVMSMRVGEQRRFVAPLDLAFKRKAFGQDVPQRREALLFDVELLVLQPY
ncbi:hypothetical protein FOA52_016245 [Chlamydomonas sp. UWO 241]|nr:hypothetical protein FOA52_016245 [Chlamydomonas sp. UWO 241]